MHLAKGLGTTFSVEVNVYNLGEAKMSSVKLGFFPVYLVHLMSVFSRLRPGGNLRA